LRHHVQPAHLSESLEIAVISSIYDECCHETHADWSPNNTPIRGVKKGVCERGVSFSTKPRSPDVDSEGSQG